MREVSLWKKTDAQTLFCLNDHFLKICCVLKCQAEKKLKVQLTSVEQQHSKTQGALKVKETELEKIQMELKTIKASLEEEVTKLQGQVTELQEARVKKVRSQIIQTKIKDRKTSNL